ncbi:MAG: TonB-dependent receptor, partial [Sphingobacteriales bacterium]
KEFKSISSRIDATAGYSYQDWVRNSPATLTPGKGVISIYPDNKTQNTLISYFGRVNYTFKDRYLLTGTVRADGSSRFPVDNKWAIFPSGAFAWDIKEESFVKDSKTISQLKLRVGYGITGQQDLPSDYPYLAKYNTSDAASSYPFGDTYYNMLRPDAYDPNIKWEETATYNVGVDFGFADGRISGTIDYFNRKTSDLLSTVQTPIGSNFTNRILTNVGNIESKGFELNLNVVPVKTKDVNWNVNFNASHYDNKVTKITLSDVVDPSSPGVPISTTFTGEALQYHKEGFAPYTYYVRKQLYDDAGKPMEGKYADLDGDGVVGEKDFYRYKSPNPTVLLGLSSNLNYK